MRRFPSSWSETLAKLGLRLKPRSSKQRFRNRVRGYGRRNTLEQLESRELLASTPWAGADLVIGDFDGDGNLDRLGSMAASTSGGEVWTIDTKNSSTTNTIESWQVTRSVGTAGTLPESTSFGNSIVGDFNGDGRDDILARTGSGAWYVIESRASSLPGSYQGAFIIKSWGSALSAADGWGQTVVGDFNGDGRDDIAAFDDRNAANKQWIVRTSTGTGFDTQSAWAELQSVSPTAGSLVAADFNGDGRDDVAFRRSGPTAWAIAISDGSRFNVDTNSLTSTWSTGRVGDFDGDGADEILGWNATLAQWETFKYSDRSGMSLDSSWGTALGSIASTQNVHIGDTNRDGRDDLVIFDATSGVQKWKVALSQKQSNGTNTFQFTAAATDDWDRWFKNWDWGPSATPYKFLNVDAPYQMFLDIFSEVYNKVELEFYPGLMKGIEATAQTKAGNDWDQAALLVDRLEAVGFDADIAFGSVTMKAQQAALWIGTTPVGTALNVGTAAYNVIHGTVDGNATLLADGSVRFKHAWVRATVPTASGFEIVDVDPSWKFKDRQSGEVIDLTPVTTDYTPVAGRDQRGTFDEFGYLQNAAVNQLPVEWYEDQVAHYLAATGKNMSLADVRYDGSFVQKQFNRVPVGWSLDVAIDNVGLIETCDNIAQIAITPSLRSRLTHGALVSLERDKHLGMNEVDTGAPAEALPIEAQIIHSTIVSHWLTPFTGQHDVYSVDGVTTYALRGSSVIAIQLPSAYHVTPHTRLQFQLEATNTFTTFPAQIAVGVDTNNVHDGNEPIWIIENADYEIGSGQKTIDIPIGTIVSQYSAGYLVLGIYSNWGILSSVAAHASFCNITFYENDNSQILDNQLLKQINSATAVATLSSPYKVTFGTKLEFEFKAVTGSTLGHLHAIAWDTDDDSSNDSAPLYKRYKLAGTSSPESYISAVPISSISSDGFQKYSLDLSTPGLEGTEWVKRLIFITDAGSNAYAESQFRNIVLREPLPLAETEITIPIESLSTIHIAYENTTRLFNNALRPNIVVTKPDGTTSVSNGGTTDVYFDGDSALISVLHSSPSDFDIIMPSERAYRKYVRTPGQTHAIGFDANQYSSQRIVELQETVNNSVSDGVSAADIDHLLNYTSAKYWYELNRSHRTIDGLLRTVGGEQWVGSGIITADPYLLTDSIPGLNGGTPVYTPVDLKHLQFPILPYNMGVDMPNTNHASFNVATGGTNDEAFQLGGYNTSALENAILEEVVNSRSVSTIRGIVNTLRDTSSSTGAWVFESVWDTSSNSRKFYRRGLITELSSTTTYNPTGNTQYTAEQLRTSTSAGLKSVHSDSVVEGIVSLLENSGSQERVVVLVPNQKSIVDSWSGSVYVAEFKNNNGSNGAYIIEPDGGTPTSGGFSGNIRKPESAILPPSTFLNQTYAGDPVNVANGNMFRDDLDFKFANPVIPLDFARHYDTQNNLDVGFGVGWVHSFTGFIYEEDDPANSGDKDYIWLRGGGERHTFENLDFTLPNTLFGDVVTSGSGTSKRLTAFKDRSGTQFLFAGVATPFLDPHTQKMVYCRLVAIKDASGHQGVSITYESANSVRVAKVESISSPSRYLQFSYSANAVDVKRYDADQLVSTWGYVLATHAAYSGKRLVEVKHASQSATATKYKYYENGPAARRGLIETITEPNGELHSYEYYANGRVFRVTDGSGNQQSFNYNLFRNLTEFTDERGNVETYIHQDNGLLTKQIHNDRSRLEFTWGPQSSSSTVHWEEFLMKSSTDERGGKEVFTYYTFDPNNASSRPGELHTSTSKDGIVSTFTYTSHPFISSVNSITETPSGGTALQTAQYTYDTNGNVLTAADAAGNVTKYEYFDATSPAHLRGLRKSQTLPKGAPAGTEDAVWQTLISNFTIAGDTLSVRLLSADLGQSVVADAVRIDRVDPDGVLTRIIDDNGPGFRALSTSYGNYPTLATYGNYYLQFTNLQGNQPVADWVFTDLEAGTYRISVSWSPDNDPISDATATYRIFAGLPGEATPTQVVIDQRNFPAGFASYQTLFEYDTAGNVTRSITEGLPAGRRAYDTFGNIVYEEDATGAAKVNSYDVLGRLTKSAVVAPQKIEFAAGNVVSYGPPPGWDVDPNSWQVLEGGNTLYLYDGARKAVPISYQVTANTVLEFDFEAVGSLAELHGIGFSTSLGIQTARTFAVGGTRPNYWTPEVNWNFATYKADVGRVHFRIPVGQHLTSGTYNYLAFVNYDAGTHPAGSSPKEGKSYFSNLRIYESTGTTNVATTTYSYDASGRVTSTLDALGRTTRFNYDANGRVIKTTFADATYTTHEYDELGNCIAITDELGRTARYVYDDRNRRIQTIYADGTSTRTQYDGAGEVVATIDEREVKTLFTYDEVGRLLTTTAAAGFAEASRTVNKYDNRGRLMESVDGEGNVAKYRYDNLDRLVQTTVLDTAHESPNDTTPTPVVTTRPPIAVSTIEYDSNGNVARTAVFDPRLFANTDYPQLIENAASLITAPNEEADKVQVTRTEYDAIGRPTKVTNADGTSTSTIYDAAGRVRFTFDELGRKSERVYDQFGRLRYVYSPDPDGPGSRQQQKIEYHRDAIGNVIREWEFFGAYEGSASVWYADSYFYDVRNRLVTTRIGDTKYADGAATAVTGFGEVRQVYDPAGQLVSTIDPLRNADYSRFDDRGRVIVSRQADPDGHRPQRAPVTTTIYDSAGNVTSTIDPLGNVTEFAYDKLNRRVKEFQSQTLIVDDVEGGSSSFATTPSSGTGTATGASSAVGYDATYIVGSGSEIRQAEYTFTDLEAGNYLVSLASIAVAFSPGSAAVEVLIDGTPYLPALTALSQLTAATEFRSVYGDQDIAWRRLPVAIPVADGGSIKIRLSTNSGSLLADAVRLDNEGSSTFAYDKNGNLTSVTDTRGNTTLYRFDELNRPTRVTTADPDGLGTGNLPIATESVYDGYGNVVTERQGTQAPSTALSIRRTDAFKYDRRNRLVEEILNVNSGTDSDDNVTTQYEYDAIGNTTLVTDAEGFQTRYRYDNAGNLIDQYRDFGEGRDERPLLQLGTPITSNPTAVTRSQDGMSITLDGSVWAWVPITPTQINHRTVLEFKYQPQDDTAHYRVVGFDTNASNAGTSERDRYFQVGGTALLSSSYNPDFHMEFHSETLPDGGILVHIPIGQYLTSGEKATGLTINHLAFLNSQHSNLDPGLNSKTSYSNIRLYESDEVRTVRTYDTRGNLETIREASDPRNVTTRYEYDRLSRRVRTDFDDGGTQEIVHKTTYDNVGNVITERNDSAGTETVHEYDRLHRLIKTTLPDLDGNPATFNGLISQFTYDAAGNLVAQGHGAHPSFPSNFVPLEATRTIYDQAGRAIVEVDGNGDETHYRYDSEGNLLSVTDAEQNVTKYAYDRVNRVTTETITAAVAGVPMPLTRTYIYDANGNLGRIFDRNNRHIHYEYDTLDRRITEYWRPTAFVYGELPVHVMTWDYDKLGRVIKQVDGNASFGGTSDDVVDTFVYDGLGRVVEQRNYDPITIATQGQSSGIPRIRQTYEYNYFSAGPFNDAITRKQYLVSGTSELPLAQTFSQYDRHGRLDTKGDLDLDPSTTSPQIALKAAFFQYDTSDNLKQINRDNGPSTTYGYDKANRVTSVTHDLGPTGPSAIDVVHNYGYDNASRVTSFNTTGQHPASRNFTYDKAGQLTNYQNPAGGGFDFASYEYDNNGNRVRRGSYNYTSPIHSIENANRLTNDGAYNYDYDKEGNIIRRTPLSDISSANPVIKYAYDHRNRLMSVTSFASVAAADAGTNSTHVINYTYDSRGRRVKQAIDPNGGTPTFSNEYFIYDGDELSMRFGNSGELTHRYVYGPSDQVLADETFATVGSQRVSDEILWQLADQQGTIQGVVDDAGTLRKHVDYDSFGRVTGEQFYAQNGTSITSPHAEAIEQLFYYTGQERDAATDLQKHGARWYNPQTGRWISEDPSGLGPDANPYRYVGNGPLNAVDPTGLIQAGNPLANLNLFAGGYTGGTVAKAKPVNSFVATGLKNFFGGLTGAAQSVASTVGTAIQRTATPFHSAIDTATYFAAANEWLSRDFIADGTAGGGTYRGGKYVRDQGSSISTQLQAFNLYAGQQSQWEGSTRSGLVSFGTALFNQSAIQANVTAAAEAYGRSRERSAANLWNTVKLWDNQLVAQNVANLVDQGSSIGWAVYGGVGTAIGDNIGVSGVYNAYEGKDFYGSRLSGWDRTLQGGLGGAQLLLTATSLKAPVTTGARTAYNAGVNGVKSLEVSAFTRFHADEFGGFLVPNKLQAGQAGAFADLEARAIVGDKLTPHHVPQAALGFTSRPQGGAIMLPQDLHVKTRTYGFSGAQLAAHEAGTPFRTVLARDIRDLRNLGGRQYNPGIQDVLSYYRFNFPELIAKPK